MHTVLVVDDHPAVGEMVRSMLESRGFRAIIARESAVALAAFEHAQFDAMLVDVDLPGTNGIELLRELRERSRASGSPFSVCLMTGLLSPDVTEAVAEAGVAGVLQKPFSMADLISVVERMCRGAGLNREAA